jgi:hypothetical protein
VPSRKDVCPGPSGRATFASACRRAGERAADGGEYLGGLKSHLHNQVTLGQTVTSKRVATAIWTANDQSR